MATANTAPFSVVVCILYLLEAHTLAKHKRNFGKSLAGTLDNFWVFSCRDMPHAALVCATEDSGNDQKSDQATNHAVIQLACRRLRSRDSVLLNCADNVLFNYPNQGGLPGHCVTEMRHHPPAIAQMPSALSAARTQAPE